MPLVQMPIPVMIDTEEEARRLHEHYTKNAAMRSMMLGIDTETTGLDIGKDTAVLWSLADEDNRYCLTRYVLPIFKLMLADPDREWALTNAKYDCHILRNSGAPLLGHIYDTVTLDWLLDEDRRFGRHGLKETSYDHMGINMRPFNDVFPMNKKKRGQPKDTLIERIYRVLIHDEEAAADYASGDAWCSLRLITGLDKWEGYTSVLSQIEMAPGYSCWDYFLQYELPYARVLYNMERRGMLVWPGYLKTLEEPMVKDMNRLLAEFARHAGKAVNLNSPDQVAWFFVEHLGAPIIKMTSGGKTGNKKPSTDKEVIEDWTMSPDETIQTYAKLLEEFRGVAKIYSTYVKGLLEAHDGNFRVHTSFGRAVTARLTSKGPNLQNVPNPERDKFGIRQAFVAIPDYRLIVADYAQLEMRLVAHFSGDQKMINAILDGLDQHAFTASMMLGVPYDDIVKAKKKPKDQLTDRDHELLMARTFAKAIGFGIVYGEQKWGLSRQLRIPIQEAEAKRLAYLAVYPGIDQWIEATIESCRRLKYVKTILDRFRHLPAINYRDMKLRSGAERQAVNSVIQGSAADAVMEAMLYCENDDDLHNMGCRMLLQVHDELVFQVPAENAESAVTIIQPLMENLSFSDTLAVPLPIDIAIVDSWGDAK